VPAEHGTQLEAPEAEYWPIAQLLHEDNPAPDDMPAAQLVHFKEDAAEYIPDTQVEQTDVLSEFR